MLLGLRPSFSSDTFEHTNVALVRFGCLMAGPQVTLATAFGTPHGDGFPEKTRALELHRPREASTPTRPSFILKRT